MVATGCLQRGAELERMGKQTLALDTTGETCADQQLQGAINALPVRAGPGASYSLPENAKLRLCGPVTVDKRLILSGSGSQLLLDPAYQALDSSLRAAPLALSGAAFEIWSSVP
jgi:hypothetical protein